MPTAATLLAEARKALKAKSTETGERNAVVRVLAKHGAYSTPKIEKGHFPSSGQRGASTLRVYIWSTDWGTLVLTTGPSIEGELQWAKDSNVTKAPKGYYHVLDKATGTSKITASMKRIAGRQQVTGETRVTRPKRKKKAAPKKAAAPKKVAPSWSVSDYTPFPLKSITIVWNEGSVDYSGKVFKTWAAFQKVLEKIGPKTGGGYTKVKFDIKWDGIMHGDSGEKEAFEPSWVERLDLSTSAGDFNPNTQYIGNYLKEASQSAGVYGSLRGIARHEVDDLDWGKPVKKRKKKAAPKKSARKLTAKTQRILEVYDRWGRREITLYDFYGTLQKEGVTPRQIVTALNKYRKEDADRDYPLRGGEDVIKLEVVKDRFRYLDQLAADEEKPAPALRLVEDEVIEEDHGGPEYQEKLHNLQNYINLHPDVVHREDIKDKHYTMWEQVGDSWVVDRSRAGAGLRGDDALWQWIYEKADTLDRPIAVFEEGFNPNEVEEEDRADLRAIASEPETMSKADQIAEMKEMLLGLVDHEKAE
jgi:hypothetical protein